MAGTVRIGLFKFIQKAYQEIGISPSDANQNRKFINSKKWFIPFGLVQFFISSAAYLMIKANSMIEYGMAFYSCMTVLFYFTIYLISFWQMKNLLNYIESCEQFIEQRMQSTISIYKDISVKIEQLTKFITTIMIITVIPQMLFPLLYAIVNYYILDSGQESFILIYPTWWPFDWRTPFGYFVAWCGQCSGLVGLVTIAILFFNIVFGSNWLFIVIADDITNDMAALNGIIIEATLSLKDWAKLMERFCDIIQIYMEAKQCVEHFNEAFKYSLFAFFSWNMVAMSSLLVTLQFQLWDNDAELFEILILTMVILWIFALNLIVCESGERVTHQFQYFDMELNRCEWNKFPIAMRRIYVIFLLNTQQSKNIRTYGRVTCTRETFKKVTMKGFSYFMTLRRFRV